MTPLNVATPDYRTDEEFIIFADSVGKFLDQNAPPEKLEQWREEKQVPREFWRLASEHGLTGLSVPEEYGGMGGDYRHETILQEQIGWRGIEGWDIALHNAIVAPYLTDFGTEEQKHKFLPGMCNGDYVSAICMTEPGAGSDVQSIRTSAIRDGDDYIVNGSKIFITNGQTANLLLVAVKTDPTQGARGTSMLLIETDKADGFERGRNLNKIGRELADTSELFFNDVRVPASNLIGGAEGRGFGQMMDSLPQERLNIAVQECSAIEFALQITLDYVKDRKAFGSKIIDFQNTQFKLAEMKTEATLARVFTDYCIGQHIKGELDSTTASMAKYWISELHGKVVDQCLQLFGGYGYMNEYAIAQAYRDARVTRIYAGTTEIMKLLIARSL
ncbi:MAG: acyl-CoA dehydrogenase family protein [Maricaulaceae bacterium]